MNSSRWSTPWLLRVVILAVSLGTAVLLRAAEPPATPLRWPEVEPLLRDEEAFGLKFKLMVAQRSPAAARRFLEDELKRNPQPYVKAYLAWICFFGPGWGMGPQTDFPRGLALAKEAIAGGSAVAQDVLGRAMGFGLGLPFNAPESARLLATASQRGSMWATGRIGYYEAVGYGVPRNLDKAENDLRRAAELGGVTNGYYDLAELYKTGGKGLPKDFGKAAACYYQAALMADSAAWEQLEALDKQGVTEARLYRALAYIHDANEGVWLTKGRVREQLAVLEALGQNSGAAQYEAGSIYIDNDWVTRDYAKALEHLNRARGLGEDRANYTLARMRLLGRGVPRDITGALSDLQLLAADGNPQAAAYLGYIYYWGASEVPGMVKDKKKAFEFSRQAAENGSLKGLLNLAYAYEDGIGVEKDYLLAAKVYWVAYGRGLPLGAERARRLMGFVKIP